MVLLIRFFIVCWIVMCLIESCILFEIGFKDIFVLWVVVRLMMVCINGFKLVDFVFFLVVFLVKVRNLFNICCMFLMLCFSGLCLLFLSMFNLRCNCVSGVCRLWLIFDSIRVCCFRWCLMCVCILIKVCFVVWILDVFVGL